MQVGQPCSTGPSYTLDANSCIKDTTFDADIDAGTTGSAAYAANLNYYSGMNAGADKTNFPYMVKAATATAGPNLVVDSSNCFLGFLRPKNEGTLFMGPDATYGHTLITEPINYATADKILFSSGKASILGGTNAGDIEFATDKQVRLWGLVNSGDVKFTLSQDIVIGDVTNSGSIVMTGTKQALVSVTNEAAGTVVGNGAGAYYAYNIVNKGAITINAGTVDAMIKCNSGTITIGAGVTGTVTIGNECTGGTITAGGATVVMAVATYASFTTSLDGITAADFTTDVQNSFKEVVATAAGSVCGADGASSCAPSDVSLTVARRSVKVSYSIQTYSDAGASAAVTTLSTYMASNQFVTDLNSKSIAASGASVLSSMTGSTPVAATGGTTSSDSGMGVGVLIVIIVVALVVVGAIVGLVLYFVVFKSSESSADNKKDEQEVHTTIGISMGKNPKAEDKFVN